MFTTIPLSTKENIIKTFNTFFMKNRAYNRPLYQIIHRAYMDSMEYYMSLNPSEFPTASVLDYLEYLITHISQKTNRRPSTTHPPYSEEEDLIILHKVSSTKSSISDTLIQSAISLGREPKAHLVHYYRFLNKNKDLYHQYF